MIFLTRRATFSASHYYWNDAWSAEKNELVFGRCANRNGHGHNYTLEVTIAGEPDPVTGFVVDLKWLKDVIEREVLAAFDHKHLNLETPEFKTLIPTTENIAIASWKRLEPAITAARGAVLNRVRVYETPEIFAEFRGSVEPVRQEQQQRGSEQVSDIREELFREEQTRRSQTGGKDRGEQPSQPIADTRDRERREQESNVDIQPRWEEFREGGE